MTFRLIMVQENLENTTALINALQLTTRDAVPAYEIGFTNSTVSFLEMTTTTTSTVGARRLAWDDEEAEEAEEVMEAPSESRHYLRTAAGTSTPARRLGKHDAGSDK